MAAMGRNSFRFGGVLVAAALAAWYLHRQSRRTSSPPPVEKETLKEENEHVEQAPLAVNESLRMDAVDSPARIEKPEVFESDEKKEEVFESFPDEEDEEAAVEPVFERHLLALSNVLEIHHKLAESDPAVIHPACVGYEFLGPAEDESAVPFNPATHSVVLVGEWRVTFFL